MQQPKGQMQPKVAGEWNTSLWGCFSDWGNCISTLFCPCITYGQIANIVDQGKTSVFNGGRNYAILMYFTCGCCLYSCFARSKLRYMFNLPPSPCGCADCVVHTCCEPCALCQEYRELQTRGFDMAVGWDLNTSQAGRTSVHAPVSQMMGQMTNNQQNNYQNGGYNNQNMNRPNAPPNQTMGQNDAYNNQNDYQNAGYNNQNMNRQNAPQNQTMGPNDTYNNQNDYQNGGYNNQNMNRQNAPPNQTMGQNDTYNNQNDYQNDHQEQVEY